jgi:hypothetical protein
MNDPQHTGTKPPVSVVIISILFGLAGLVGLIYHGSEFKTTAPFDYLWLWVCLLRLLALVCAVFLFLGKNWARWVLILWLAYHVGLSALHSWGQVTIHGVLAAIIAYFLFRPQVSCFFRRTNPKSATI